MNLRILCCLLAILIWPKPLLSQLAGNATLVLFPSTPTGTCNSRQLALDQANGSLYTCINAAGTNQGTWQIVAGGGGPGGWNPPSVGGDTLFGNNTVGTSVPSFFIPGGDVSFSSGNFSVNSLHFGPNSFALTNSGIATGNCLQVSGGSIIGGACGTSGLSGTGTVNLVPKFTAATVLGNSLLTDNGTTLNYTGSGGIAAPKITMNGVGPYLLTSVTGTLPSLPGAGENALASGPDGWYVSNANGAFFKIEPPGTGGAGGAVTSVFTRTGAVTAATGDYQFSQIGGTVASNQLAASLGFTGTPTAPTAAQTVDNTQLATTAFVHAAVSAGPAGALSGSGSAGYMAKWTGATVLSTSPLYEDGTTLTYAGTGGMVTTPPANTENSNRVATTKWVKDNFQATGGGGGQAVAIADSGMTPACLSNDTASNYVVTFPVVITAGDTVLVTVANPSTVPATTAAISDNVNTYHLIRSRSNTTSGNVTTVALWGTQPGAAQAASSMTVTLSAAAKFVVCVATKVGVNAYGTDNYAQSANLVNASNNMTLPTQDDNGYVFVVSSIPIATTASSPGNIRFQHSSTTPQPISSVICEGTSPTATSAVGCNITWGNSTAAIAIALAVELRPGAFIAPLFPGPKVVAYKKANITVTTIAANNTAFMTCSATDCPAGYYRVSWDFLSLGAGCTNGTVIANVDYFDEADLNTAYHTGMATTPSAVGPGRNHVFGYRLQTVAKPFSSTVGIQFTTTTEACSAGTGTAQMTISVERLQ